MNSKQIMTATLGGAALFTGLISAPAQAFTAELSDITDAEFNQLILDGKFSELFVAESRTGNAKLGGGERELGINDALEPDGSGGLSGADPLQQGQLAWQSGETVEFLLSYDAMTGKVDYTVDGVMLTNTFGANSVNGIFIRTNAQGKVRKKTGEQTTSSSFAFDDLMLDDGSGFQTLPDLASFFTDDPNDPTDGDREVNYLVISDLNNSFSLKGTQTLAWEGLLPDKSRLAAQIKVGSFSETESVPEPMTLLGAAIAMGAGYVLKNRRDQENA